ncbi:hypothetical protein UFOVP435_6 [uncultured Caudovirales phage]|uniref:Uncharacterized protein n=1 Tax=uncultured Caudovirales phage TaxID=2100421 RepID=A0A6J5MA42_9CAUD|nr:hypothetical protein UFOVP435_6 [uncultured Caudovirales phage]
MSVVWVVYRNVGECDPCGPEFSGVFSTRAGAEAAIAKAGEFSSYTISEQVLDTLEENPF